jgi:hypothetical protein
MTFAGIRSCHGLLRLLWRAYAQHAPRGRRVGIVHDIEHWHAVSPRVFDHARHQLDWIAGHSARVCHRSRDEWVSPYTAMGNLSDLLLRGHPGCECCSRAFHAQMILPALSVVVHSMSETRSWIWTCTRFLSSHSQFDSWTFLVSLGYTSLAMSI